MPRSYFSGMVRGGGAVALAPSRPVSNLWKSAQMEGAAVESAGEAPAAVPFRRVRAGAALDPATEPVVRPSAETKTETREVAPMRARKVVKSSVALTGDRAAGIGTARANNAQGGKIRAEPEELATRRTRGAGSRENP